MDPSTAQQQVEQLTFELKEKNEELKKLQTRLKAAEDTLEMENERANHCMLKFRDAQAQNRQLRQTLQVSEDKDDGQKSLFPNLH